LTTLSPSPHRVGGENPPYSLLLRGIIVKVRVEKELMSSSPPMRGI